VTNVTSDILVAVLLDRFGVGVGDEPAPGTSDVAGLPGADGEPRGSGSTSHASETQAARSA
jgi:hypothetical protein